MAAPWLKKMEVKISPPKKNGMAWKTMESLTITTIVNPAFLFGGKSSVNFQGQIMLRKLPALILPRPEVSFAKKKRNEVVLIRAEKHNKQAILYKK